MEGEGGRGRDVRVWRVRTFFFLLSVCGGKERNGKLVKQAEQWECSGGGKRSTYPLKRRKM